MDDILGENIDYDDMNGLLEVTFFLGRSFSLHSLSSRLCSSSSSFSFWVSCSISRWHFSFWKTGDTTDAHTKGQIRTSSSGHIHGKPYSAPPGVHVNVTSGSRNVDGSAQINVTSQSPESLGDVGFLELGINFKTYAHVFFLCIHFNNLGDS